MPKLKLKSNKLNVFVSLRERGKTEMKTERDTESKTEREKQEIQESEVTNPTEKLCQNLKPSVGALLCFQRKRKPGLSDRGRAGPCGCLAITGSICLRPGSAHLPLGLLNQIHPGVSNLLVSLGHTRRRRVAFGHTLNTQTLTKTGKQKVLSKFWILCWVASGLKAAG